jgi:hypothetical protein
MHALIVFPEVEVDVLAPPAGWLGELLDPLGLLFDLLPHPDRSSATAAIPAIAALACTRYTLVTLSRYGPSP